jgi:hypothetical protein
VKAEYVKPDVFLNMHGSIRVFSEGYGPLERKYLTLLLLQLFGKRDIRDIDLKNDINEPSMNQLHKMWTLRVGVLNQEEELSDLCGFMRPKTRTQLRDKVKLEYSY